MYHFDKIKGSLKPYYDLGFVICCRKIEFDFYLLFLLGMVIFVNETSPTMENHS